MDVILSIIIPTYNMESFLRKCLNSLIVSDENMGRLEVLVINDGSKDSSSQIGHEYESKYPRTFRVIDKENGNYGSCINCGLKEAKGKYVKVLDADDYYTKEVFDLFIDYLHRIDVDLIINDFRTVDPDDKLMDEYTFDLPVNVMFSLGDIPLRMTEWIWHHGITYRTDILRSIDYKQTEGISYTDDEWVFVPMAAVNSVRYFPHVLYCYLNGREGQTFDPKVMMTSFDKRIVVGKSMVKSYSKYCDVCSNASKVFMGEKIRRRLTAIYNFYLKMHYTPEGNMLLKDFDSYIKNHSIDVYESLEKQKDKFGRSFIGEWRKANYKSTFYIRTKQWKYKLLTFISGNIRNIAMPSDLKRK